MRAKAVLLDIDGVLFFNGEPIPGAAEAIRGLQERNLPFKLVTNITRHTRAAIAGRLREAEIVVEPEVIHTALAAAAETLRSRNAKPLYLITPIALADLPPEASEDEADTVFVGDVGKDFGMDDLNRAFRVLHRGASLLAGHKNRFWITHGLPTVDAGALVAALEYCSGVEAELIGKPEPGFFRTAARSLLPEGATLGDAVMVGDRWESDVEGARAAGLRGVLVRTGLYQEGDETNGSPDGVLDSIAGLMDWLEGD
ncbi:MAG: HAD-IIA family hydrolase [Candidatus Eisenbacteria bacterium]